MSAELLRALSSAKVYDLAHTYRIGMPHHPVHPPYLFGLTKTHGEHMRGDVSSAGTSGPTYCLLTHWARMRHSGSSFDFQNFPPVWNGSPPSSSASGWSRR